MCRPELRALILLTTLAGTWAEARPARALPWAEEAEVASRAMVPAEVAAHSAARRLLLLPAATASIGQRDRFHRAAAASLHRRFERFEGLEVVELPVGRSVAGLVRAYRASGLYASVEEDFVLTAALVPDDPRYADGSLWHLHNTGLNNGREDADIDAPEAWELNVGAPAVLVAVIDSGVRLTHQDLAPNLWTHPGEIADNGIDDDGNGYIDDVYGINAIDGSGDPGDVSGHGTHVAGIIAAAGNNGLGITGVAWNARILPIRFLDAEGQGLASDAIESVDYALAAGADLINASWGSPNASAALERTLRRVERAGIPFIAAAGNVGADLATEPQYPAAYTFDNLVAVAATTRRDALASYSNYGAPVLVAAPGSAITSTWFSGDAAYRSSNGTSMAAPVVTGILAHLRQLLPAADAPTLLALLAASTDPLPELDGKTASGGRVNLRRALEATGLFPPLYFEFTYAAEEPTRGTMRTTDAVPGLPYRVEASADGSTWTLLETRVAGPDGLVEWSTLATPAPRFYRLRPDFIGASD